MNKNKKNKNVLAVILGMMLMCIGCVDTGTDNNVVPQQVILSADQIEWNTEIVFDEETGIAMHQTFFDAMRICNSIQPIGIDYNPTKQYMYYNSQGELVELMGTIANIETMTVEEKQTVKAYAADVLTLEYPNINALSAEANYGIADMRVYAFWIINPTRFYGYPGYSLLEPTNETSNKNSAVIWSPLDTKDNSSEDETIFGNLYSVRLFRIYPVKAFTLCQVPTIYQ